MKKVLALILALTMIFALCACGQKAEAPVEEAAPAEQAAPVEEKFVVGFVNMDDIYPYCIKLRDALVEYAAAEGMEVLVTDGKSDPALQNSAVENYIAQGVDAIVVISTDPDGNVPAVNECVDAGIPYISLLTQINSEDYLYIGSVNEDAGRAQGAYLAEVLPEGAKVCYLTHRPNDSQTIGRKAGLVETLFDVRTDVELLSEQNCENQQDKGMSITEDWLQAYDHIDCIVAQNDDSALGAIEALKAVDRLEEVMVVGLDASAPAIEAIKAGEMAMSVYQDAFAQAQATVDALVQYRAGTALKDIPEQIIPFTAITIDNIDDAK